MNLELEIGLVLALIGALLGAWHLLRRQRLTRTRGNIVRVEVVNQAAQSKNPVKHVKLTIRFNDGQGLVRFFSGPARGDDRKPGDSIGVLYSPADPSHALIDDMSVWVAPIVVGVIGLGLAAMGYLKQSGLN